MTERLDVASNNYNISCDLLDDGVHCVRDEFSVSLNWLSDLIVGLTLLVCGSDNMEILNLALALS